MINTWETVVTESLIPRILAKLEFKNNKVSTAHKKYIRFIKDALCDNMSYVLKI